MAEARPPLPLMAWRQVRYENRLFWRTPMAAFFTLFFPLMFLLLFNLLFSGDPMEIAGRGSFTVTQFFAPSLAAFAAASATYTNIGIGTAIARDQGILKRFRGTPLPPWVYMAGRVASGVWIAGIAVVIMILVGVLGYDLHVYPGRLPAVIISFVVGTASFAALGLALAALAPTSDSAPAVANATILPIAFISDVFIPISNPPGWLVTVGNIFPLKHFVRTLQDGFSPFHASTAPEWGHIAVMALWGVAGVLAALRFFVWEPKTGGRRWRRQTAS
ncbi:MAG: ABC transporter permease [Actinomycetota bacterium]